MNEVKVRLAKDGIFPIHVHSEIVAIATDSEQAVLTEDISRHGQREPITLWKGAIVDGRCRQAALTALGLDIMYRELDDDLSDDEVRAYVKSANTRRNLTHTQKVMTAAKDHMTQTVKRSLADVAKSWGVSKNIVANAKWLYNNYLDVADGLFNAKGVNIINNQGKTITSTKVSTVYAYYRKLSEAVVEVESPYGWKDGSNIKSQAGKDWFYSVDKTNTIQVEMLLTELANFKFPVEGQ